MKPHFTKIEAGTKFLHVSDDYISSFYPRETCFFYNIDSRDHNAHYYLLIVKEPIYGRFDITETEVRIDL